MKFFDALDIAARDGLIMRSMGPHKYRYFVWAGRVCVYDRTALRAQAMPPIFASFPPVETLAGEWEVVSESQLNDERAAHAQNALQRHRKPQER